MPAEFEYFVKIGDNEVLFGQETFDGKPENPDELVPIADIVDRYHVYWHGAILEMRKVVSIRLSLPSEQTICRLCPGESQSVELSISKGVPPVIIKVTNS